MDNTVTMSLEDYTNLIKENILLKAKIDGLKRNATNALEDQILDSRINTLNKEEALRWLDANNKELIEKFSSASSWRFESIARECLVLDKEEVKTLCCELIKRMINSRLQDLIAAENTAPAQ